VSRPMTLAARLVRDDRGATSIEYALIGTLISVGIIVALSSFASAENGLFMFIRNTVVGAIGS